ncbi:glycosyltransferase [Acidimicrobiia bacterium]|nr:glycosyltransferase [Acidimicrobiia bacterium]
MINLSIILPTINEADNLKILIPEIIKSLKNVENVDFEIIVSDDGSSDNTKELLLLLNLEHKNVHLHERTSAPSLPMSIWDGIEQSKNDYVLWMDADGSMPAKTVKELVLLLKDNPESVIVGSRFVDGGAYKGIVELEDKSMLKAILNVYKSNDTVLGMILSNLFNKLLRFIFSSKVHDITSGFIVGKKDYFSIESFNKVSYGEYFILVIADLISSDINIIEKGYVCETRKYGSSKTATSLLQLVNRGYPYIVTAIKVRNYGNKR